jgi:Flp pilus assembly protein CpaB
LIDRSTRIRNLGVAGGLALLAAILTMLYVQGADGGTAVTTPPRTVAVLVATRDLPVGTPVASALADGAIAVRQVPAGSLAADALRSPRALRGLVVQPIYANEPITSKRLGRSGTQGFGSVLRGAFRALAVSGDARQLLAGTLERGDHVDVVVNDKLRPEQPRTRIALRNLVVLQPAGDLAETASGDGSLSATLQLTDRQVQVLWWAVKNGDWSLVLRPSAKAASTANAPTRERDVLEGS